MDSVSDRGRDWRRYEVTFSSLYMTITTEVVELVYDDDDERIVESAEMKINKELGTCYVHQCHSVTVEPLGDVNILEVNHEYR